MYEASSDLSSAPSPESIAISPSTGHVATFSKVSLVVASAHTQGERCVRIITTNVKGAKVGVPQEMRHPRELASIAWRTPRASK